MSGIRGYLYRIAFVAMLPLLPATGYAQEATLAGTVTDSTGGVLPGVTITALHEASGNTFVAVTDDRGAFRVPGADGRFQGLPSSSPDSSTPGRQVELLVGQTAVVAIRNGPGDASRSRSPSAATSPLDRHGQLRARRATWTRDRCRSCRSTAATSWTSRCSPSAAARTRRRTSSAASAPFS